MPVSYAELKAMLDVDEPDYGALAEIADGATGHLRKLAASPDVSLATKAVSLAGFIGDAGSVSVIASAAKSREPLVRVAAAHAATLLPDSPEAARIVDKLLDDKDIGVVKNATRAAARQTDRGLPVKAKRAIARIATAVRAAAKENARRERKAKMVAKARKTASRRREGGKAASGKMPTGAMTEPRKGAKARTMPTGKMS